MRDNAESKCLAGVGVVNLSRASALLCPSLGRCNQFSSTRTISTGCRSAELGPETLKEADNFATKYQSGAASAALETKATAIVKVARVIGRVRTTLSLPCEGRSESVALHMFFVKRSQNHVILNQLIAKI